MPPPDQGGYCAHLHLDGEAVSRIGPRPVQHPQGDRRVASAAPTGQRIGALAPTQTCIPLQGYGLRGIIRHIHPTECDGSCKEAREDGGDAWAGGRR